ncbi:hypothetical protein GCM10027296_23490 [Chitinimonas naiadis]
MVEQPVDQRFAIAEPPIVIGLDIVERIVSEKESLFKHGKVTRARGWEDVVPSYGLCLARLWASRVSQAGAGLRILKMGERRGKIAFFCALAMLAGAYGANAAWRWRNLLPILVQA